MVTTTKHQELMQQLLDTLNSLPTDALEEVAIFVDYQRYKANQIDRDQKPRHPVALGGIWKGIKIDEEDIAAARRDMWAGVEDRDE